MNIRGGNATKFATERAQKLIDALGLGEEVTAVCIDQGNELECLLAIPSVFGHHFLLRFRTDRHISREKMAAKFVEATELLQEQRQRMALRR
jgi:hypothetical protein